MWFKTSKIKIILDGSNHQIVKTIQIAQEGIVADFGILTALELNLVIRVKL